MEKTTTLPKTYPSDVSREQFEIIRPTLEAARVKTKPRRVDLYKVFCGVLYVLRGGIQWRMVPKDFPKWRTVYNYWQIWDEPIAKHRAAIAPVHQPLSPEATSDPTTTLDVVLKKIGWHHPKTPWTKTQNQLLHQ